MSFTLEEVEHKMKALASSKSFDELNQDYRLCTTNQWDYNEARQFAFRGLWRQHTGRIAYRPFDRRWTVFHKHVGTIQRQQVMSQLKGTERNLGLISSRAVNDLSFAHCFVTSEPTDKIFISSKTSTNAYVFPLYLRVDNLHDTERRANFSRRFLALFATTLGMKRVSRQGIPEGLTAEDILYYIYAVLHSPGYRGRYAEFLKEDFPRLPLTANAELFRSLAHLGAELVALHLMDSPKLDYFRTTYTGLKNPQVRRVGWSDDTVWLDTTATKKGQPATPGTIGFRGVPEAVWNFHVGGYQVCEKWLKDRKGRTLSDDDITHYQKIIVALAETIRLMREIDEVIEEHGGWPGAFAQGDEARETADAENVVSLPLPKSAVFTHQALPPPLQKVAEPEARRYEAADKGEPAATRPDPDEQDREDLICSIRHMFGDGAERERGVAIDALAQELGREHRGSELEQALRTAVDRGILASERESLRLSARNIEQYERSVLKEQFLASLSGQPWVERDDAIRAFARWMGFRRTGRSIDEAARSLINGLLREKRIERNGSHIRRAE
jgi:Type ISP C-terminal specificity domain